MTPNAPQPDQYDSPWKEILRGYFRDFLAFFLPVAHDGIDWQHKPVFLDKELNRITREARAKNRRVDLLVKVWLRDGQELWILIHVEIQGDRNPEFPERMYTSHSRAYDLHRKPVVGLAILTDDDPAWRVNEYRQEQFGSELIYRFNAIKLLDYLEQLPDLEQSDNPFAIITLAHLRARQTRNRPDERYDQKMHLTRSLYRHSFSRQRVLDLYRFIDWILYLPPEADDRFWKEMSTMEEEKTMRYVTSVERIGMQKGMEKGVEKGKLEGRTEMLLELLQEKFGQIPETLHKRILSADLEQLTNWGKKFAKVDSLQAVFQ
ncbi:MAG: hypothetical protein HQL91_03810 [Magnetococcales bacterium]|nr:hypothetical protein [Magnetococcales bacterium]